MANRTVFPLLIVVAVLSNGCDNDLSPRSRGVTLKNAEAVDNTAQPVEVPCPTCNGTGRVTESRRENLPAQIVDCRLTNSSFLGLGSRQTASASVQNNGEQGGTFTLVINGQYPGGGQVEHGRTDVYVAPHEQQSREFTFYPQQGMTTIVCNAEAPGVVTQYEDICSTCGGRGRILSSR
jgi:DnaJ-class molecular chaperone